MTDPKRLTLVACGLLVVLRIAIGWQFLYEGLWKLHSQSTARPWTAAGYLGNATGPFRATFRNMTDDPYQRHFLNVEWVSERWETWQKEFATVHELDEDQRRRLERLLDGPPDFRAKLKELPEGLKFKGTLAKRLTFVEKSGRLIVDGKMHLTPRERDAALKLVRVEKNPPPERREANERARLYQEAIGRVFARSARLSFKERLQALLIGNPDRAGLEVLERGTDNVLETRLGEIELYDNQIKRYEDDLAAARTQFERAHADLSAVPGFGTTAEIRGRLVGPIQALEAELVAAAEKLLKADQRALGPVEMPATGIKTLSGLTIWALVVLGLLLIAGLCSRVAAVGAAGMLLMFYLVMPPWPGVPPPPGPEHSLWVNKNLIEAIALLALAALPTGRWFGLDAILGRLPLKFRRKPDSPLEEQADEPTGEPTVDVTVEETVEETEKGLNETGGSEELKVVDEADDQ